MTKRIVLLLFVICLFGVAFVQIPVKKIIGHWGSLKDMSFAGPGDTMNFEKKKYDPAFYSLPKYKSGIEFTVDTLFKEYHNIAANADEDNIFYHNEKYYFVSDSIVEVKGVSREFKFKILQVTGKKLSIKILQ